MQISSMGVITEEVGFDDNDRSTSGMASTIGALIGVTHGVHVLL